MPKAGGEGSVSAGRESLVDEDGTPSSVDQAAADERAPVHEADSVSVADCDMEISDVTEGKHWYLLLKLECIPIIG